MSNASEPTAASKPDDAKPDGKHLTTFYVDGEELTTDEKQLTVKQILEQSGNKPPENFYLIEYQGQGPGRKEIEHRELGEAIKVHEKQEFSAVYVKETPLS